MPHLVAPSILSADFSNLKSEIEMINNSTADWIHVDVMDGVFVPNISFGVPVIKSFKKYALKPLDVHLMIVDPDKYIKAFKSTGADILTVHYEACTHLHRTVNAIKEEGMMAGVAINPHTSVQVLQEILSDIDLVCLMSVNPGFAGQKFINNTFKKIKELKSIITSKNLNVKIEVDGGVDLENAERLIHAGTDILVAGNTVFSSPNPTATISKLKSINTGLII